MKKKLLTVAIGLAIISCQQEELLPGSEANSNSNRIELVQIIDGTGFAQVDNSSTRSVNEKNLALKFDSEATYQSFLKDLKEKSHKERMEYVKSYGLTSLQELAVTADNELEEFGSTATSEADFRTKYEKYKEKYEGILVSNKYDSEDLSLYVPDGDNLSTYVLNANHAIVVGNEVKNISINNDMGASDKMAFASTFSTREVTSTMGDQKIVGKKKTTYGVDLQQNTMLRVHVGCQKKLWYGWKTDNARDIYYHLEASPFTYSYWLKPAGAGAPSYQVDTPCPDIYYFSRPGHIDYESGYITGGSKVLTGILYVWTDQLVESALVKYSRVVKDNQCNAAEMNKCDKSKAYTVEFTVNYLW